MFNNVDKSLILQGIFKNLKIKQYDLNNTKVINI